MGLRAAQVICSWQQQPTGGPCRRLRRDEPAPLSRPKRKPRSMKQKYEGKDLQGLVDLGREQGYLTFDQVNDFLPQDVASPTDLRAALESFEEMDIKVLEEVPAEGAETDVETETKEEAEEAPE